MFKGSPCLRSALLALAVSLVAVQSVRAQAGGGQQQGSAQQSTKQQTSNRQGSNRPAPLEAGEKIERSFRSAFLSPVPYAVTAFTSGITQLREERLPHKDNADEFADWGSRAARSFATRTTSTLFSSGFYPALFRQDPRYEPSQSRKAGERVAHALSRVFVARGDNGRLQPNYSRFAGSFTASALANVWERSTPGHDRIGADATFRRFGRSFIFASLSNVVLKEFGPDILGVFRR